MAPVSRCAAVSASANGQVLEAVQGVVMDEIADRRLRRQHVRQMFDPVATRSRIGRCAVGVHLSPPNQPGEPADAAGDQIKQGCRPDAEGDDAKPEQRRGTRLGARHVGDVVRRAGQAQAADDAQAVGGADQHARDKRAEPSHPSARSRRPACSSAMKPALPGKTDRRQQREGDEEGEARRAPQQRAVVGQVAAVRALVKQTDDQEEQRRRSGRAPPSASRRRSGR
jgi:hypothetical protein